MGSYGMSILVDPPDPPRQSANDNYSAADNLMHTTDHLIEIIYCANHRLNFFYVKRELLQN
eukprot:7193225-Ditylum_brightwellii.AAC.1